MSSSPENDNTMLVWKLLFVMMLTWTILVSAGSFRIGFYVARRGTGTTRGSSLQPGPVPAAAADEQQQPQPQPGPQPMPKSSSAAAWQPSATTSDMTINSLRRELSRRRLPVTGHKEELAARLVTAMAAGTTDLAT